MECAERRRTGERKWERLLGVVSVLKLAAYCFGVHGTFSSVCIRYIVRSFIQLPVSHEPGRAEPSTFMNVRQLTTEKLIESRPNYMIVFDFAVAAAAVSVPFIFPF